MKFINRCRRTVLLSVLCFSAVFSSPVFAAENPDITPEIRYNMEIQSNAWENWPAGPQVYAESAIIMEASTGTILYSKNADQQMEPASITKIMTVLLALENLDLDEEITFSHNAVYSIEYDSSHIARDEGEILTAEECLYAIMLESANECSNAVAEQVSGSVEAFADLMNERAAELGCVNTHFTNPHGLPNKEHYTSAHDMALITQEAIKYEKFRQIAGTPRYTLRATNKKDEELLMNNHHFMISQNRTSRFLDDTVFCGKTGYTSVALNTLVTCATRNGMDLVVVSMKTQSTGERGVPLYTDTANLLNYASENFHRVSIAENETNFTIGQGELFDTGSPVFGTANPMIEMDKSGYVILPVNAAFSDAAPRLEFQDADDSRVIATLSYTYAGQTIGATSLYLTDDPIHDFNFQKTDNSEAVPGAAPADAEPKVNLIKINLRIVGIAVCSALLLLTVLLFIRKLAKDFEVELNPIRRWQNWQDQKNAFGSQSRRHYRSRKRRRHRRGF